MTASAAAASTGSLPRQALLYASGEASMRAAEFLLIPLCTRFLLPADFGRLDTARALGALWMVVLAHGTHEAYLRQHFDVAENGRAAFFSRLANYNLLVGIVGTALAIGVIYVPRMFDWGAAPSPLVILALLVGAAQLLPTLMLSRLQADSRPLGYAMLQGSQGAALLLFGAAAVALLGLGAEGLLESRLLVFGIASAAVAVLSLRTSGASLPSPIEWRSAVLYGLPLAGHAISWQVLNSANRPLLLRFAGAEAAGVFGVAYSLGVGLTVIITVYNRAWLPRLFALGEAAAARDPRVRLVTLHLFATCCGLATVLGVFAPELCRLLAPPAYAEAAMLVPFTAFAFCFLALYQMFANLVWLSRRTGLSFGVGVIAAVANVLLNLLLIPLLGVLGAAVASLAAFALFAYLTGRVAAQVSGVQPPWAAIGWLGAGTATLCAIGVAQDAGMLGTSVRVIIVLLAFVPVAVLTRRLRAHS